MTNQLDTTVDTDWMTAAACRGTDPDLFFPTRGTPQAAIRAAQAICATCPVVSACRTCADLTGETHGIWGGETERGRRQTRRAARIGHAA